MPVQAFFVFLGVGKQAHENQCRYNKSGYEVLYHSCHSGGSD